MHDDSDLELKWSDAHELCQTELAQKTEKFFFDHCQKIRWRWENLYSLESKGPKQVKVWVDLLDLVIGSIEWKLLKGHSVSFECFDDRGYVSLGSVSFPIEKELLMSIIQLYSLVSYLPLNFKNRIWNVRLEVLVRFESL